MDGLPSKDGFLTPRESTDKATAFGQESSNQTGLGFTEWAPYSPSLPCGAREDREVGDGLPPCWLPCDASVFDVRNIRYKQTREKIPSEFSLYDCVGMDLIKDKRRIDGLMDRLPSQGEKGDLPSSNGAAWDPSWGIPRVSVVNCQAPYQAGRLIGRHP